MRTIHPLYASLKRKLIFTIQPITSILFSCSIYSILLAVPSQSLALDYDFTNLSLEELAAVKVTSVSKKAQFLSDAAAAVFVLTEDDIKRSGVRSIPDALRMVPGMQVAQINAHNWAISTRGFSGRFSNKLLVLIDGRSVYTPLFSGVFWDIQDILLEDIDRIEVIRGPGATLWGANAVNGIINIITKRAKDTQGVQVIGGVGSEDRGFGSIRFGHHHNERIFYRGYLKYFDKDDFEGLDKIDAHDSWSSIRGGFRTDWMLSHQDNITISADIYKGSENDFVDRFLNIFPFREQRKTVSDFSGGHILGLWTHKISETSDLSIQFYFDRTEKDIGIIHTDRNTYDLDVQHNVKFNNIFDLVWGVGYRFSRDDIDSGIGTFIEPESRSDHLFNIFVQNEIHLIDEELSLIFGTKIEHNDYTEFEFQPNSRIVWTPNINHSLWGAVSRAVRTPSRADHDIRLDLGVQPAHALFPGSPTTILVFTGNDNFDSEELTAYEVGYRFQPRSDFSLDITTFFNVYENLRSIEAMGLPMLSLKSGLPRLEQTLNVDNNEDGETYGIELASRWNPSDWMQFDLAYTYLQMQLHDKSGVAEEFAERDEGRSPHNNISLRANLDLSNTVNLDTWLRYVDSLPTGNIDSYLTLNLRLAWKPSANVEVAIVGQNLLDNQHAEFESELLSGVVTEVQRSVYSKITLTF